jgi:SAM-dependent methyltransferase
VFSVKKTDNEHGLHHCGQLPEQTSEPDESGAQRQDLLFTTFRCAYNIYNFAAYMPVKSLPEHETPAQEYCCMTQVLDNSTYYTRNAKDYFDKTSSLDSSNYLNPFLSMLSPGDKILDLGCGSGRDLLLLKTLGFNPFGFERSPDLAGMARNLSGCPVIEGDFLTHDFSRYHANALIFSASLVHSPHREVAAVLDNVLYALNDGGFIFISVKEGDGLLKDSDGQIGRAHV